MAPVKSPPAILRAIVMASPSGATRELCRRAQKYSISATAAAAAPLSQLRVAVLVSPSILHTAQPRMASTTPKTMQCRARSCDRLSLRHSASLAAQPWRTTRPLRNASLALLPSLKLLYRAAASLICSRVGLVRTDI